MKTSGLINTKPKNYVSTERRVRTAKEILKVEVNKPYEITLAKFFAVEKKLSTGMVISNPTRCPAIHLAVTGTIPAEI